MNWNAFYKKNLNLKINLHTPHENPCHHHHRISRLGKNHPALQPAQAKSWPEIRNDFQLDAVITVVDTPQLLDGKLESGSQTPGLEGAAPLDHKNAVDFILNQQLESADVVVLNKVDELNEDQLLKAE